MANRIKILLLLIVALTVQINAQQVLDKIAAVVDKEIILKSEVEFRAVYEAAQRNLDPKDSTLLKQVLNSLIEEKLLYAQAELDSVVVPEEQIQQQLDYQINYITQQYGSKEKLEEAYKMSIDKLKRNWSEDTRKNLMAQTVQNKKFGDLKSSRKEVEDFFDANRDSLGVIPERYEISHIFQNPKTGERVKNKAKNFALALLDSIKEGKDFAALARKYSDDPGSAAQGGDLGFVKRGVFYPEFEAAAFALGPGQLSSIILSPVGYHIIQLLERRGDAIHSRHILIKIKSDGESDLAAIELLNDLRDSILSGKNSFAYYAIKFSDDHETGKFGGSLGIFEQQQLDKTLSETVLKLKEDEISFPKRLEIDKNTYGYHIVKLVKKIPQHKASIEMDYDEIKKLAEFYKKQKLYANWIQELKDKIFWEVRI